MNTPFSKEFTRRDFLARTTSLCFLVGLSSTLSGCGRKEPESHEPERIVEEVVEVSADFEPAYLKLHRTGELKRRAEEL